MIRRDVQLADGRPAWALISQVEHARISALLASHCRGRFGAEYASLVRDEVLVAIAAHDDGWVEWEQAPRLDPQHGRPLSFMELPVEESTAIWSRSIAVADQIGPLAAWMVSGHFVRLLEHSEHARSEPLAAKWVADIEKQRVEWLARWQAIDPPNRTLDVADEALQWLWTFDETSLWFCCSCPAGGETGRGATARYVAGKGTPIELTFLSDGAAASEEPARSMATARPWRFDVGAIDLDASALLVPATRYETSRQLLAAAEPHWLRWRVVVETRSS
jgi:hypothetical protein